ncbi:hypothetical protein C0989_001413 [Termitomyces sp. Mn162]|nr:hypothetical protein C0989_001413 [Termitomyces sp. Mn162]
MDNEIFRLHQLVHELSDQLAHNQKFAASLHAQTAALRAEAAHAVSGVALRRFNTDLAKESFESELERANAKAVIEKQILLHENKQLSHLLKEYETTMETIMSKFRNHAAHRRLITAQLAAQRHELTLTRHYETLLQARETQSMSSDLLSSTETAQVLLRLSHHLCRLLRSMAGDDDDDDIDIDNIDIDSLPIPDTDWALDRESEISRLEHENALLRHLLQIDDSTINSTGISLDPTRDDPARFAKIIPKRIKDGGDPRLRPGFWDGPLQPSPPPPPPPPPPPAPPASLQQDMPIAQGYLQGPGPGPGAGAVLQRALDLQPGMRMGTRGQGRRSGIIGRGARRGLVGVQMGDGWHPPGPWQGPGAPAMDLMR